MRKEMLSMSRFTLGLSAVLSLVLLAGCQATQLTTSWRDPAAGQLSFQKVAVIVLHSSPAERRAQEDAIVEQIHRAKAVPSYTFVSDAELADQETVKRKVREQGCDGAVVLRLVSADKRTTYTMSNPDREWSGTWSLSAAMDTRVSTYTDTYIQAEVSLYSVADNKLIWAGSASTANPPSARDFALEVAKAAAEELRKQGLIPAK
jgi:hypothetical protein